ncbi:hypothetical protein ACNKHQ_23625 [Shigella flexneri]
MLTEAAVGGKRDELRGLKENVIVGRLIPAVPVMRTTRIAWSPCGGRSFCRTSGGSAEKTRPLAWQNC